MAQILMPLPDHDFDVTETAIPYYKIVDGVPQVQTHYPRMESGWRVFQSGTSSYGASPLYATPPSYGVEEQQE